MITEDDNYIGVDDTPPDWEDNDISLYELRINYNGTKVGDRSSDLGKLVAKYNKAVDGVHDFPELYEVFTAVIYDFDKDTNIYSYDIHEDRA